MLPTFGELLTHAGFTLRGKNRATCANCSGHDRTTVAYYETYAYCFRCGWKSSYTKLARELGILSKKLSDEERAALDAISAKEKRRAQFLSWQNEKLKIILKKIETLRARARMATQVLERWPDEETAWAAVANFYHNEIKLYQAFDFFSMTPVSRYLDQDSCGEELIQLFNEQIRRDR
jgi:hypothetical protein